MSRASNAAEPDGLKKKNSPRRPRERSRRWTCSPLGSQTVLGSKWLLEPGRIDSVYQAATRNTIGVGGWGTLTILRKIPVRDAWQAGREIGPSGQKS